MKSHVVNDLENVKMENQPENRSVLAVKSIDSIIFDSFRGLTNAIEEERIKAGLQLLQHIAKTAQKDKRVKEVNYVAKRLIRGVGASTTISRAGFFTTLVGFLETIDSTEMDVRTVLEIAEKQLHIGHSISNKEDADALVGQILTCGALLRANRLGACTEEDVEKISRTLLAASKHRSYHNALAFSFMVELLTKLSEEQFTSIVWPIIGPPLARSWEKQTINTVHCLITAVRKFPKTFNAKYLKATFGGHSLLNAKSSNHLFKLFWENTSASSVTHPAYECFARYIATSKYLETFWSNEVDGSLETATKISEIATLKIMADILATADPKAVRVSNSMTKNFVNMTMNALKKLKQKKDDTIKAFYDEFLEALFKWTGRVDDDNEKVEIIKKLILHPGTVTFEKLTGQRVIHQIITNLGENGIKEIFEIYKKIFLAILPKDPTDSDTTWLNTERQCAGYMLQHLINHKTVQTSSDWRAEQLKFFMTVGLFHTNDGVELVNKKEDNGNITADLAQQMKNAFYTSLQSKLPRLKDEKKILFSLVEFCNEMIERKGSGKLLRNPVDEKILKAWGEMRREVLKAKKTEDKLKLVFQILLLHMGLQLFHEPEMAETAIWDLEKCMERTNRKGEKKKSKGVESDEPDWIEVVVDLFLHLLSHNTSSLKNVVNAVFPHLCDSLSLTAVHQILSVLDMQDGKNPLSERNEQDEENAENEEKDDAEDSEGSGSEEEEDDDDEEMVEEEEEEGTYTDALRNAVSQALMGNAKDDDQVSIDLDDMTEEEGNRLDEALSGIFSTIMKPKQYKKTKKYRVETTTTMHFRIRVLDLIENYIQHKPNLLIIVEIMISLYNMIEFCTDSELKPLANKVERVLTKLTALRQFTTIDDIREKNICDYLRIVIEKKVTAPAFDMHNRMKAKCCAFLIACTKVLADSKSVQPSADLIELLTEYIEDFIKSRNPTITATLLNDVFKMRWLGVWRLAGHLAEKGLHDTTRTYRRIQIIELLDTLYKNHELIRQDSKIAKKTLKLIETRLQILIESLAKHDNISTREYNTILNILFSANRCHLKIPIDSHFEKSILCDNIQAIRKKIKLENQHSYARFCNVYGVKIIRNNQVAGISDKVVMNGHVTLHNEIATDRDEDSGNEVNAKKAKSKRKRTDNDDSENKTINGGTKRKASKGVDSRKEKRLRKEERLRALSKGMDMNSMGSDDGTELKVRQRKESSTESSSGSSTESSDDSDD